MALYTVSIAESINLAPSSVVEEVIQNIQVILSTQQGTVPLDRDFGIDWSAVDEASPMAMMLLRSSIIDALKAYEPRAVVRSIEFKTEPGKAMDGTLFPVVTVEISEDE